MHKSFKRQINRNSSYIAISWGIDVPMICVCIYIYFAIFLLYFQLSTKPLKSLCLRKIDIFMDNILGKRAMTSNLDVNLTIAMSNKVKNGPTGLKY